MTTVETLKQRYLDVKERVAHAAQRSGRVGSDIMVVAVSKYAGPDEIRELIQLGHVDFGENQVQQMVQRVAIIEEWLARHRAMKARPIRPRGVAGGTTEDVRREPNMIVPGEGVRWHMIGHLQRNKVRKALEICRLIHSVDSLRIAEEIQGMATRRDQTVDVLLQVNTSGEQSKFGCAVAAAPHLADQIDTMINVRVRGLMCMAPYSERAEDSRHTFARCRELFEEMQKQGIGERHFNILSMGMSGDFEVAVSEGSNLVRIGSSIFGAKPKDQAEHVDEADEDDD